MGNCTCNSVTFKPFLLWKTDTQGCALRSNTGSIYLYNETSYLLALSNNGCLRNSNLRSFEFLCCRNFLDDQWFPQLFAQRSAVHSWFAYEGIRSCKKLAASCRNCTSKWTKKSFWNCSKGRHVGSKFMVPSLSLFSFRIREEKAWGIGTRGEFFSKRQSVLDGT